jgi:hypothetical protein
MGFPPKMSTEREKFGQLSPEEKHQLALLGSMLARPALEEDQYIQRLMDACVDAKEEKK